MDFRITMEWNSECGIPMAEMYPFREELESRLKKVHYGNSITQVLVILNALGYDVKQRKRYKKELRRMEYDIILDYFLIKNSDIEEKKSIIRKRVIQITEQTFEKYKFQDFDKAAFLKDFANAVNSVDW